MCFDARRDWLRPSPPFLSLRTHHSRWRRGRVPNFVHALTIDGFYRELGWTKDGTERGGVGDQCAAIGEHVKLLHLGFDLMRIAVVSTPFIRVPPHGYGGTELFCAHLAEGLLRRGHHVSLFATGDPVSRRFALSRGRSPMAAVRYRRAGTHGVGALSNRGRRRVRRRSNQFALWPRHCARSGCIRDLYTA